MKLNYTIIEPSTAKIVEGYFFLRWEVLRKPWNKDLGTERDELEEKSIHACAISNEGKVIGVGRLHKTDELTRQVRYMAVHPEFNGKGIGKNILIFLEEKAVSNGGQKIILHAREHAVGFYTKLGYTLKERSHLLFGEIQHYLMEKDLR